MEIHIVQGHVELRYDGGESVYDLDPKIILHVAGEYEDEISPQRFWDKLVYGDNYK